MLERKIPKKDGKPITCDKCKHHWLTKSAEALVTCSGCGRKVVNPYAVTRKEVKPS